MENSSQRIQFIVNPVSGRRRERRKALDDFGTRLTTAGHRVDVHYTRGAADATDVAASACAVGVDLLVVGGGDGTVHEAVAGMGDFDVPVLIAPCGTENVVAKYLGLRLRSDDLWAAFAGRHIQPIRLLSANSRKVLFALGVGFDSEVIRQLAANRKGRISYLTYAKPILRTLWCHQSPNFVITVDDRPFYEGPGQVIVGKVPRYALGLKALWRADPADEWVDVLVLPRRRMWGLGLDALRIAISPGWLSAGAFYAKGKSVRITSEARAPVQMDGECAGETPIEIGLSDQTVRFLTGPKS